MLTLSEQIDLNLALVNTEYLILNMIIGYYTACHDLLNISPGNIVLLDKFTSFGVVFRGFVVLFRCDIIYYSVIQYKSAAYCSKPLLS